MIVPILQMRRLSQREFKWLVKNHKAFKQGHQDSNFVVVVEGYIQWVWKPLFERKFVTINLPL